MLLNGPGVGWVVLSSSFINTISFLPSLRACSLRSERVRTLREDCTYVAGGPGRQARGLESARDATGSAPCNGS